MHEGSVTAIRKIATIMLFYWLLVNIVIIIVILSVNSNHWLFLSGFNVGFCASFIAFISLVFASKWLTSHSFVKQVCAYLSIIVRMIIYGSVIVLAIFFPYGNLISIILGLSVMMLACFTNELWQTIRNHKQQKEVYDGQFNNFQ